MSIVTALPGIRPTARPYTMGQWPQGRLKMRSGRTAKWGLSSLPTGDRMELVWENITYAQAEQLAWIWDTNYGIFGEVTLPPEILAGTSGDLTDFLAEPVPNGTWHFVGAPEIDAVKAGRCSMRMLIGVRSLANYDR